MSKWYQGLRLGWRQRRVCKYSSRIASDEILISLQEGCIFATYEFKVEGTYLVILEGLYGNELFAQCPEACQDAVAVRLKASHAWNFACSCYFTQPESFAGRDLRVVSISASWRSFGSRAVGPSARARAPRWRPPVARCHRWCWRGLSSCMSTVCMSTRLKVCGLGRRLIQRLTPKDGGSRGQIAIRWW